jgi:hypothetical protein
MTQLADSFISPKKNKWIYGIACVVPDWMNFATITPYMVRFSQMRAKHGHVIRAVKLSGLHLEQRGFERRSGPKLIHGI